MGNCKGYFYVDSSNFAGVHANYFVGKRFGLHLINGKEEKWGKVVYIILVFVILFPLITFMEAVLQVLVMLFA